jgi:hypothetical protein
MAPFQIEGSARRMEVENPEKLLSGKPFAVNLLPWKCYLRIRTWSQLGSTRWACLLTASRKSSWKATVAASSRPNEIAGANAGLDVGLFGKSWVVPSLWPGVARFDRSAMSNQ